MTSHKRLRVLVMTYIITSGVIICQLYQPTARKSVGERAFGVTAPKSCNNLPTDLHNLNALSVFKRKLTTHFFRKYFNWYLKLVAQSIILLLQWCILNYFKYCYNQSHLKLSFIMFITYNILVLIYCIVHRLDPPYEICALSKNLLSLLLLLLLVLLHITHNTHVYCVKVYVYFVVVSIRYTTTTIIMV